MGGMEILSGRREQSGKKAFQDQEKLFFKYILTSSLRVSIYSPLHPF